MKPLFSLILFCILGLRGHAQFHLDFVENLITPKLAIQENYDGQFENFFIPNLFFGPQNENILEMTEREIGYKSYTYPTLQIETAAQKVKQFKFNSVIAIPSLGFDSFIGSQTLAINFFDTNYKFLNEYPIQTTSINDESEFQKFGIVQNTDTTLLFAGILTHLSLLGFNNKGERLFQNHYYTLNLNQIDVFSSGGGDLLLFALCKNDIKEKPGIYSAFKKNDLIKLKINQKGEITEAKYLFNVRLPDKTYQIKKIKDKISIFYQTTTNESNKLMIINFDTTGLFLNQEELQIDYLEKFSVLSKTSQGDFLVITKKTSEAKIDYYKLYHFNENGILNKKQLLNDLISHTPYYLGYKNEDIYLVTKLIDKKHHYEVFRLTKRSNYKLIPSVSNENEIISPPIIKNFSSELLENLKRQNIHNPNAVAIIIGNAKYKSATEVTYAENDANAMFEYFHNYFGIPKENIILIKNASKTDFETVFGSTSTHKGKLYNYVKDGLSDVYVFYSGHGAPGLETKTGYFVPVDCDPNYVEIGGYSLNLFYSNLAKIPSLSTTVFLDACFSGASIFRNISPITVQVKNTEVLKNAIVITSSSDIEVSGWYNEKSHGLFTYYLLNGLKNKTADLDNDGIIRLDELNAYLTDQQSGIPYMARRLHGIKQTPAIFSKDMNRTFYSFK